ncbi:MAG: DUF3526 domain-containing protein [Parasphingorhabdus sp.]
MSIQIARHDLRSYLRSGVFATLAVALVALLVGAAALSSQRLSTFERERSAAEAVDREVWDSQGARNPHSAAHFARYAFKPVSELMAFDPGVTDYAGLALWMEAHNQNPAVFRRAEDLGDAGRFADLSPAWILQYIAPLFLFLILFAAIAGEREQGTWRQMAAAGLSSRHMLAGKLMAAGSVIVALMVLALLLSLWGTGSNDKAVLSDIFARGIGLAVTYGLYLIGIGAVAIGVSALCREKRTALIALVGIWTVSFVLIPRLAASAATTIYPVPSATAITADLSEASNAFYQDTEYRTRIDEEVLKRYEVDRKEDLPINYGGYSLQASEKHAEPLFEAVYAGLDNVYEKQEALMSAASFVSPVLALDTLSAGLAGTDRGHHRAFTWSAEQHRRTIIEQLNNDLTYKAAPDALDYTNDETLWRDIPDFAHSPPSFSALSSEYLKSLLILLTYALGGIFFAAFAVRRAHRSVAI